MRIPFMKYYYSNQKSISGVIENFSRTFEKAKGLWLKAIAGDDLFYTDAIKSMRIDAKNVFRNFCYYWEGKSFWSESKENAIYTARETC